MPTIDTLADGFRFLAEAEASGLLRNEQDRQARELLRQEAGDLSWDVATTSKKPLSGRTRKRLFALLTLSGDVEGYSE